MFLCFICSLPSFFAAFFFCVYNGINMLLLSLLPLQVHCIFLVLRLSLDLFYFVLIPTLKARLAYYLQTTVPCHLLIGRKRRERRSVSVFLCTLIIFCAVQTFSFCCALSRACAASNPASRHSV